MKREGGGEKRGSRDKGGGRKERGSGRKVKGSGKGLIHILLLIEINDLIFPYKFLKIIIIQDFFWMKF